MLWSWRGRCLKMRKRRQGNQIERTEQALDTQAEIIAAACPFCNTMMTDGIKNKKQEDEVKIMDVAELIANANNL